MYIFVTGESRGIGKAVTLRLGREGDFVIVGYNKNDKGAKETVKEIKSLGGQGYPLQIDVSNPESVKRAYKEVSSIIPRLDVLVNNAGIFSTKGIRDCSLEEWERVIRVDLTGVFLVTKTFLPLLEKRENLAIANISSLLGLTAGVAEIAYHAAKAGVVGLSRKMAVELAPKIRVNAVAPSFIKTDMTKPFLDTEEKRRKVEQPHPLWRISKPEDMAKLVYFLASPASSFITGKTIAIDGGRFIY